LEDNRTTFQASRTKNRRTTKYCDFLLIELNKLDQKRLLLSVWVNSSPHVDRCIISKTPDLKQECIFGYLTDRPEASLGNLRIGVDDYGLEMPSLIRPRRSHVTSKIILERT